MQSGNRLPVEQLARHVTNAEWPHLKRILRRNPELMFENFTITVNGRNMVTNVLEYAFFFRDIYTKRICRNYLKPEMRERFKAIARSHKYVENPDFPSPSFITNAAGYRWLNQMINNWVRRDGSTQDMQNFLINERARLSARDTTDSLQPFFWVCSSYIRWYYNCNSTVGNGDNFITQDQLHVLWNELYCFAMRHLLPRHMLKLMTAKQLTEHSGWEVNADFPKEFPQQFVFDFDPDRRSGAILRGKKSETCILKTIGMTNLELSVYEEYRKIHSAMCHDRDAFFYFDLKATKEFKAILYTLDYEEKHPLDQQYFTYNIPMEDPEDDIEPAVVAAPVAAQAPAAVADDTPPAPEEINLNETLKDCFSLDLFENPITIANGQTLSHSTFVWTIQKGSCPLTRSRVSPTEADTAVNICLRDFVSAFQKDKLDDATIKKLLTCPITNELFKDPVTLKCGITIDREELNKLLQGKLIVTTKIAGVEVTINQDELNRRTCVVINNLVSYYKPRLAVEEPKLVLTTEELRLARLNFFSAQANSNNAGSNSGKRSRSPSPTGK